MRLAPEETILTGSWIFEDGRMAEDSVSVRIRKLVAEHLCLVARSADGWEKLYRDPTDGRYWELTYPHGAMQGGGPQALLVLSEDAAFKKYGLAAESETAPSA